MKRWIGVSLLLCASLEAATISQLLDSLKKQPITQVDEMEAAYAKLAAQKVKDRFYPEASLFGTYEHYSAPTNLRPMSPLESPPIMLGKKSGPLPFATTIERLGGKVSMPIFVKSLFALSDKADAMAQSAAEKSKLNLLRNEAGLVGAVASWRYMKALDKAIEGRIRSIEKMVEDMKIKVQSGRAPGVALDKLNESLNRLETAKNEVQIKVADIQSRIEALTGLRLQSPAPLAVKKVVERGELFALKPLEDLVAAKSHDVAAEKGKLYPQIGLSAMWSENYGQSALNPPTQDSGDDVHRSYGNYMVGISMPLFSKPTYTAIQQAQIDYQKEKFRLDQARQELVSKADALRKSVKLYERSEKLARKSVENQKSLLRYAKVAYEAGRLSEEEYLRYEEALLDAQSKEAEAMAKRRQSIAQLAVIYGVDLAEVFE